jgi:predicted SnoaL-like aldol condensation-catalyzing enzyme
LLEAGHWDKAGQYLTEDYIQHNLNARSGREAVVDYFTKVLKVEPRPIPARISMKGANVMAEGDLVVVTFARTEKDPKDASKTYRARHGSTCGVSRMGRLQNIGIPR